MTSSTTDENLKREIDTRSLTLAIVNMVIGSGIFALPAIVAEGLGAVAILAYIVCGVIMFLLALCFAELGSRSNKSGGAYRYIEDAFGRWSGFVAGNIYIVGGCMASDAAVANAMADTLQYFFPSLGMDTYRMIFLLILFSGLGWLNVSSVKNGIRFVALASIAKLIPLILLIVVAIPHVDTQNLKWVIHPTVHNIGAASLLLFFAFLGIEVPLTNGGEIKNPHRTVPRAVFWGIAAILVLYISVQLVTQGVLGDNMSAHKEAALAAVAGIAIGKPGMIFITVVTLLAILGSLSGAILSIPRILFAGARDGLMPKALAKIHPRFATPYVAIWVYVAIDFVMAVSGGFKQLAIIASASSLILYLGVALSSIKLIINEKNNAQRNGFRIPGGVIVPLVVSVAIIWLLSNLANAELTGIAVFILIFSAVYIVSKQIKRINNKMHKYNP
ncbi:MAG: amino acid permease [Agriterribacter sp.]